MKNLFKIENFFVLVIFCAPLYLLRVNIFNIPTNVFEMLAVFAIFVWLLQEKNNLWQKFLSLPRALTASCMLILTGLLLSIFFSKQYWVGLGIFKSWFVVPMLFGFAVSQIFNSIEKIENIFKSLFFSISAVAVVSVFYKFLAVMTYDGRLASFYSSPNYLAMYLAPGIFLGWYFLKQRKLKFYFLYPFLLAIIIFCIFFTYSYGTWVSIIFSLLITTLSLCRKKVFLIIFYFFIFSSILIISQLNTSKFSSLIDYSSRSSLASRVMIWRSAALMLKQHPIVGIGPGNFQGNYLALQPLFPPYLEWAVPQPHNLYLAFWLESGLMGLLGLLFLMFYIFSLLQQILKNKKNACLAAPILAYFIYFLIHGLIDTPYWKNDLSFIFWVFIATTIILYKLNNECKN